VQTEQMSKSLISGNNSCVLYLVWKEFSVMCKSAICFERISQICAIKFQILDDIYQVLLKEEVNYCRNMVR
jgi:hypothetical protein